jgi:ketosteroid isomerase-like protein
MRHTFITALALLATAGSLAGQSSKSANDQQFQAVYAKFTEAYRRGDPQMVTDLYTRDAFYLQPGSKIERGYDFIFKTFSFLNSYKNRPNGGPAIGFEIVDRQISGNIGWDIGYYMFNDDGTPPKPGEQPDGKFIVLWKRDASGQWKIFADGYSDVRPPAPAPTAERVSAEKAVVRAVQAYFDGIMNNDSTQLDFAFHPDAYLSATMDNGRVYRAAYSDWRKFTTRPKGDPTGKTNRITNLQMNGNAAVVTTVLDWPTVRYVDYLSLIKTGEDEWKIVSKIWHQEAKKP